MARTDYGAILSTKIADTSQAIRDVENTVGLIAPAEWGSRIRAMHSSSDYDNVMAQLVEETTTPAAIASFTDGANNIPVKELICTINPTETGTGAKSPQNPYVIGGHTGININAVDFNQLIQNGNFVDTTGWSGQQASLSVNNGIATITRTANYPRLNRGLTYLPSIISGHKYLFLADIKKNQAIYGYAFSLLGSPNKTVSFTPEVDTWKTYSLVYSATGSLTNMYIADGQQNATEGYTAQIRNVNVFDLTQMFGSTIADYIYSLEQGTAGAGVTVFRQMFYKDYYAYTTGGTVQYIKDINGDNYPYATASFGQTVYGGELNVTTGELTIDRATVTYNNANDFSMPTSHATDYSCYRLVGNKLPTNYKQASVLLCDRFNPYTSSVYARAENAVTALTGSKQIIFSVSNDIADANEQTSLTAWNTWLSNNPTTICYELETPIVIQLTPTEVKTLLGANNIYHDCNGNTKLTYRANGALYVAQH